MNDSKILVVRKITDLPKKKVLIEFENGIPGREFPKKSVPPFLKIGHKITIDDSGKISVKI